MNLKPHNLGVVIASEYRDRTGRNPIRIVLHKTSKFEAQERAGFGAAWQDIPEVEFITLDRSPLNLMPRGDYPPRRGTLADLNGSKHLYTTGFYEPWGRLPRASRNLTPLSCAASWARNKWKGPAAKFSALQNEFQLRGTFRG